MKLGAFSVGLPLYEIESDVTYQTVRTPTVFERMVMRLCGRYRTTPEIARMTLSQIFEQQLGVASANELVGPSVENLIYMGVLAHPGSTGQAVRAHRLFAAEATERRRRVVLRASVSVDP